MFGSDFLNLSLAVQVSLASGYLAYVTAYAGYRRHHSITDATFISLAFGSVSAIVIIALRPAGEWLAVGFGAFAAILAGLLWRVAIKSAWQFLMSDLGVHSEDGAATAWDSLIQKSAMQVQQVAVRTKDGRTLLLNRRDDYLKLAHKGLILGGDGAVVMVIEEEVLESGERRNPPAIHTENGLRLTYIPASEIKQVSMRIA